MDQPLSVLSVSQYMALRDTREWILKRAGLKVISARDFIQAISLCRSREFNVAIIGHTMAVGEQTALLDELRRHCYTRVLWLYQRGDALLSGADYALDAMKDPEKLIATIRAAIKKSH